MTGRQCRCAVPIIGGHRICPSQQAGPDGLCETCRTEHYGVTPGWALLSPEQVAELATKAEESKTGVAS